MSSRPLTSTPASGLALVLVADDDADMRLYIAGCLRRMGAGEILEADDGKAALRVTLTRLPDLIVSDMLMPERDGLSLCHAVKADPRTHAIPFLVVSGELQAPPFCADGFLAKPFDAAGLRRHIEALVGPPR